MSPLMKKQPLGGPKSLTWRSIVRIKRRPKDVGSGPSILFHNPSDYQEMSTKPAELVDLPRIIVPKTKKRPIWHHDKL
jgi:hypothetical protein